MHLQLKELQQLALSSLRFDEERIGAQAVATAGLASQARNYGPPSSYAYSQSRDREEMQAEVADRTAAAQAKQRELEASTHAAVKPAAAEEQILALQRLVHAHSSISGEVAWWQVKTTKSRSNRLFKTSKVIEKYLRSLLFQCFLSRFFGGGLIDLIIELLDLIIKTASRPLIIRQRAGDRYPLWLSVNLDIWLIIKSFEIFRLQNMYSQIQQTSSGPAPFPIPP